MNLHLTGVAILASLVGVAVGLAPLRSAGEELLYNGIRLPSEWPPRTLKQMSPKPMPVPYLAAPPPIIPIDVGRQLFVDEFLIESTTLRRQFHAPEKFAGNPILRPETQLELQHGLCPMAAPFSDGVFYDGKDQLFKMWYHAGWFDGTALATSRDGIKWVRPKLDVVSGTNRLIPDRAQMRRDGMSIWLDHDAKDVAERFKMFLFTRHGDIGAALNDGEGHVLSSPDGIHWDFRGMTGPLGDNSTMFYNPFRKKWVFSIRSGSKGAPRLARTRSYWECDDFVQSEKWGKAKPVFWVATDELDQPDAAIGDVPQLYKLDAVAYESVMLGLFEILYGPANEKCATLGVPKTTDLQVAFSRDGFHWDRTNREPFIAASRKPGDWERGYISSAGGCCLIVGDRLHFYYGAFKGDEAHKGGNQMWSGMYADAATGLATLRRDGFASMEAGAETGTLTTRTVKFAGKHLFVNLDAPRGALRVEVLAEDGKVIAPFTCENSVPVMADSTRVEASWNGVQDLSTISGHPVRFRFYLKSGGLYAFWVSPEKSGISHGYVAAGGPEFDDAVDKVGEK